MYWEPILLPFFWAFLLAVISSYIFFGTLCNGELFLQIGEVEVQATLVLKCFTIFVMSSSVLRESFISLESSTTF